MEYLELWRMRDVKLCAQNVLKIKLNIFLTLIIYFHLFLRSKIMELKYTTRKNIGRWFQL